MMDNNKIASELLDMARELSSTDKISRRDYPDIIPDEQKNKDLYEDLLDLAYVLECNAYMEDGVGYRVDRCYVRNRRDIAKGINDLSRAYGAKKRDIEHYLMLEIAEIVD